jgi:hypothetical protein
MTVRVVLLYFEHSRIILYKNHEGKTCAHTSHSRRIIFFSYYKGKDRGRSDMASNIDGKIARLVDILGDETLDLLRRKQGYAKRVILGGIKDEKGGKDGKGGNEIDDDGCFLVKTLARFDFNVELTVEHLLNESLLSPDFPVDSSIDSSVDSSPSGLTSSTQSNKDSPNSSNNTNNNTNIIGHQYEYEYEYAVSSSQVEVDGKQGDENVEHRRSAWNSLLFKMKTNNSSSYGKRKRNTDVNYPPSSHTSHTSHPQHEPASCTISESKENTLQLQHTTEVMPNNTKISTTTTVTYPNCIQIIPNALPEKLAQDLYTKLASDIKSALSGWSVQSFLINGKRVYASHLSAFFAQNPEESQIHTYAGKSEKDLYFVYLYY